MFTASWVVSCLFFSLELFPKTRKRRNSKETSQPGKKRRPPDEQGETAEKSSKETKHRKSQQDKKVKKSVKFKATKKGVKNRGKHVKLKRKSRKWYRTSCLASKSSQILEALQMEESNKILKNKDFATIDVQIYSLRGFEMMLLSPTHFVVITQELRLVESGGVTGPPAPLPHTHTGPRGPHFCWPVIWNKVNWEYFLLASVLIRWLWSKIENTVSFRQNLFYSLRVKVWKREFGNCLYL